MTRDAGVLGDAGLRAGQRHLRRRAGDQKPLALLVGRREHEIPLDLARRRGDQVLAAHERAGVERHALAVAREERLQGLGHGAAQQALQRRALAEDASGRQQILGALPHSLASGGHGELDAREAFGVGEAAQRADREHRHRGDGQYDEQARRNREPAGQAGRIEPRAPLHYGRAGS